jgi:uncharacterized protein YecT (DUF1311 family)
MVPDEVLCEGQKLTHPRTTFPRAAIIVPLGLLLAQCAPESEDAAQAVQADPTGQAVAEAEECADVTPNAAYSECFRQLANAAQDEVTAELAKARELVAVADEEYSNYAPNSPTIASDRTRLTRSLAMSQEDWTRYVANQCELEAEAARGGSGTDTLRQLCLLRLARQRLAELRGAAALIDGNR